MQRKGKPRIPFKPREPEHKINELIRAATVRVVGDDFEPRVLPIAEALALAEEKEVDLVEISPNADPPVCRLVDYNKFIYEKKKKDKEQKAKSKQAEVKEIRFTPNTDDHDFDFKLKHAIKFLQDGDKVKTFVQFRGRSILFQDRGQLLLLKFAEKLADYGTLESMPKMEGRRMFAIFTPKKKK
ncbi:MAG TPA: translation initiation factor IF-3 [Edaphocola sp.]|nr:translation initiation factor IF-3 [Edaphocola sp.]